MSTFVDTVIPDTEAGIDELIFKLDAEGRWQKVREKIEGIDIAEMKNREKVSKLDIIKAFANMERPKGSKEAKEEQRECQRKFHVWYENFLPKAEHSKRNLKSNSREVKARIKSNPAEYFESTEGFKNRMRSIIANPSSIAIKYVAIKMLSKAYPK